MEETAYLLMHEGRTHTQKGYNFLVHYYVRNSHELHFHQSTILTRVYVFVQAKIFRLFCVFVYVIVILMVQENECYCCFLLYGTNTWNSK